MQITQELFEGILHETARLSNIIQNFRQFAKGGREQRQNVNLNALVQHMIDYNYS